MVGQLVPVDLYHAQRTDQRIAARPTAAAQKMRGRSSLSVIRSSRCQCTGQSPESAEPLAARGDRGSDGHRRVHGGRREGGVSMSEVACADV